MHGFADVLVLSRAVVARDGHADACGKPHEDADDEVNQRAGGAHGRQRRAAGKLAYDHNVRGVIEQLQHAGSHQGQGKPNDFAQQRPAGHVHFIVFSGNVHGIAFHNALK